MQVFGDTKFTHGETIAQLWGDAARVIGVGPMSRILAATAATALLLAPTVETGPTSNDPSQWPAVDNGAYTTPGSPSGVSLKVSPPGFRARLLLSGFS